MNITSVSVSRRYFIFLWLLIGFSSCQQEEPAPAASSQHAQVNSWILNTMKFWYLWTDDLPVSPDMSADPETFFKSLLVSGDRFSWIQEDYRELIKSLQGISREAGYEFVLYKESESSDNVHAQVLYIKPASPAETAGLKRGDLITHVNDQQITVSNYKTLLKSVKESHTIRYKPLLADEQKFDTEKSLTLSVIEYTENPNYLSKVITVDGKKIGYYVYNFFAQGTDENEKVYETEMENIFQDFKANGITELVLDLRFNSGGSEAAANSLASYVGKGISNSTVFAKRSYNEQVEKIITEDPNAGPEFLITRFAEKTSNIGDMLTGGRVYVLTSSRTASASELIINALRPFMEVFLIGDVTYGKNVGSITLNDENNPANTWGLQPIVVKVYNSLGQSDYGNGFSPDVLHKDNSLFLQPLGDVKEALLSNAIGHITGTATTGREPFYDEKRTIVGHSLDAKQRSFNLIIDEFIPNTMLP